MLKELEPIVDQLELNRATLHEALEGTSPEQLEHRMPGSEWSIKDALAHLAANEAILTEVIVNIAIGSDETEREFDSDAINAQQVERGRALTFEQVWRELEENRHKLLRFLNSLTPAQLQRRGSHPYEGMMNVREFLVVLYSHEREHVQEIVEAARQLKQERNG